MTSKPKIAVALSGGVDSAVSAYLLKQQGFDVFGINMKLPNAKPNDLEKLAEALKIPLHIVDFTDIFTEKVIDYFKSEYQNGRTPNPCVICNKFIKFGALLQKAEELGADFLATGHYARIKNLSIQKAKNLEKDQSYFLSFLDQAQIAKIKFPLGEFVSKEEIREIAKKANLPVYQKKDSQEICFVPDDDYRKFLDLPPKKGDIVRTNGKKIGEHEGLINYTIGQRKGLGHNEKVYVKAFDIEKNLVIVGEDDELYSQELTAEIVNLTTLPKKIKARIRYRHAEQPATAELLANNKIKIIFDEPQRAITPGQILTIYDGDLVVGGGIILC